MTIQDAVKSGKPFKRKDWFDECYIYVDSCHELIDESDAEPTILTDDDILADDWEVKE